MTVITIHNLTMAIKNSIDSSSRAMEEEEAYDLAHRVLNFFGYADRIIDNILEPEDRDAFYMLEDAGILTTEREETTLYDGREWRIHYWLFRRERINELLLQGPRTAEAVTTAEFNYDELPDDIWQRGSEN
ncbi:DUF6015 family protein [Candidatus Methanoprimaticola sp. MG2]|mgnify:CR=1 FL=1|uniref:DUF6015 family protein n=1 Tax=Candidatus Methanoprimaticola sp. MG2 TaxID=3228838 RepID=UPI0039C73532